MRKLFIIFFTCISLFAIEKTNISTLMEDRITTAIDILKQDQKLSALKKAEKIFPLFDDVFDYTLMTKLSLGKNNWLKMSLEQREEFTNKFVSHLKNSFMQKLELYTDEKLKIMEAKNINKKRIALVTMLIGTKDTYSIVYKFYKTKTKNWLIYDVNIIGVSLIQTYRVQFENALKKDSYFELLSKLDKK